MIFEIKCSVCSEVMGTLEKHDITDQDILEYQKMVVCSNGHLMATEMEEVVLDEDEWGSP